MSFNNDYSLPKLDAKYHLIVYQDNFDAAIQEYLNNRLATNLGINTISIVDEVDAVGVVDIVDAIGVVDVVDIVDALGVVDAVDIVSEQKNFMNKLLSARDLLNENLGLIIIDSGLALDRVDDEKINFDRNLSFLSIPLQYSDFLDALIKNNGNILLFYQRNPEIFNIVKPIGGRSVTEQYWQHIGKIINPTKVDKKLLYYPYLDLPFGEINDEYDIFNTNGLHYQTDNPYTNLYKRFDNQSEGIYIASPPRSSIIPAIIHQVWLIEPDITIINKWKKIIHKPWVYKLWTKDLIDSEINIKWKSSDPVFSMVGILELYGGIAIDNSVVPIKLFNTEILSSPIISSYADESLGTNIRLNILGAIKGTIIQPPSTDNTSAARKPFTGVNNFFINLKNNAPNIKPTDSHIINVYQQILVGNRIEAALLSHPNITIYPSNYVKQYVSFIIPERVQIPERTPLIRDNITTPQSMVASLMINPLSTYLIKK